MSGKSDVSLWFLCLFFRISMTVLRVNKGIMSKLGHSQRWCQTAAGRAAGWQQPWGAGGRRPSGTALGWSPSSPSSSAGSPPSSPACQRSRPWCLWASSALKCAEKKQIFKSSFPHSSYAVTSWTCVCVCVCMWTHQSWPCSLRSCWWAGNGGSRGREATGCTAALQGWRWSPRGAAKAHRCPWSPPVQTPEINPDTRHTHEPPAQLLTCICKT